MSDSYSEYGELKYIGENSILEYKKNLYLSAKATEICYMLLNREGDEFEEINEEMLSGESSNYAAIEAIIAGDNELALRLVGENSFIGSLLLGKYEEALNYPLNYQERAYIKQAFISIAEGDEKGLEENIIARIKQMRREAKIEVTMVDIFSLGILKAAKMRGMTCNVNVAELPKELLEDTTIDYDKWQLPIPEHVQKLLDN